MKIKIKNNQENTFLNILNEDNNASAPNNNQTQKTNTEFNMFEGAAEYQYILQRKKEALPVNIILPQSFSLPVKLPTSPEDINNIMSSYQNNKARKTKNIGGVMQDPIQTYNLADACCRNAFGNFFGKEIKFEGDEQKRQQNEKTIDKNTNESYNYKDFPVLNESAEVATLGLKVGTGIGSILAELVSGGIGTTAGLAATVGVQVAALGGAAYMLGYWGEELFGNVEGGGISNDEVAAHLIAKSQQMIKPTAADPQQYTDIVEAIGTYVKDIMEACTDIASVLTPDGANKLDELSKFVNGFIATTSKKAEEYIDAHSKQIEEEKELERQRKENKLEKEKSESDKTKNFCLQVAELFTTATDISDSQYIQKITNDYKKNLDNKKGWALEDAIKTGKWSDLINVYKHQFGIKDSVQYEFNSKLNEGEAPSLDNGNMSGIENAEHDATEKHIKLKINACNLYDSLLKEFESRFKEAFPNKIDGKTLPKYEETRQQMQDLIDAADKSINNKIDQITKVQGGSTANNTGGLGQAAIQFLNGHPLESNNLREVWSRHLVDLKSRMTNRLAQMTDTSNKTRTLGWTIQVCRTKVPEILARMLTYRYIYALLSNAGFFSYDTAALEADKKHFQADKDIYVALPKSKLIWLLNNACSDYTQNGGQILIPNNETGGWTISNDPLVYVFFLISKLSGNNNGNLASWVKTSEFLANIKNFVKEEDQVNQLLNTIVATVMTEKQRAILNSENTEDFAQLVNLFKMSEDIKNSKKIIQETYNKLQGVAQNINNISDIKKLVNIQKSIDLMSMSSYEIYKKYIDNKNTIDNLISNIDKEDQSIQDDIRKQMVEFFGDIIGPDFLKSKEKYYNNIKSEDIKKFLPGAEGNDDYYSQILCMFPLKGNRIWGDDGKEIESVMSAAAVQQVCKVVNNLCDFIFSGILAYTLENKTEEINEDNKNVVNKLFATIKNTIIPIIHEYNNVLNAEVPDMDDAKKGIYTALKEKLNSDYNQVKELLKNNFVENNKDNKVIFVNNLFDDNNFENTLNLFETCDNANVLIKQSIDTEIKDGDVQKPYNDIQSDNDRYTLMATICKTFKSAAKNIKTLQDSIKAIDDLNKGEAENSANNI